MTIKCIAFDLDDTLWECHPVIMHAEKKFYDWLHTYYSKLTDKYSESALIEHRIHFIQAQKDRLHDLTYLRKNWLKSLADEVGYNYSYIDSAFEVFWLARNEVTFFDDTLDILKQLSENYSLGVISNGNADVNHIGVGHLFDFVLSSEKAGIAKPHQGIFEQALVLAATKNHETAYVGDDPKRDVLGAHGAGLHAIWFNPMLKPWPGGRVPTAVIQHLNQLQNKLTKL